ncbi:MAG TPA: ABC transporter ATP-binding protein [Candidatus Avipropionibacterium avicola]|uniref:ABC transporter ATP-binding protein n=1 Tax=Candidatus Avipropionibacterium avicola TaxID=2840701 RepID=A0A9D1GY40_9ACTN|nr:ABC transporter ATP-binding protein [Candidatus Avipropionibacterium avicola]
MLGSLLRTHLRPYRGWLTLVVLLQLVATIANLFLPSLNATIIDDGVSQGNTDVVVSTGMVMLAVSAAQILCQIVAVFFGARTAMAFGRDVRAALFHQVLGFSAREVNQFGAPSLITRNTNDVVQVQMLVMLTCTMMVGAPIMMVGGVIMALREDVGLSWLIVVAVALLATAVGLIVSRMSPQFRVMQTRIDVVNRVLREQITGIRVVRAFVREPQERARFDRANADLTHTATIAGRWMATMFPVVMLMMNLSSVAVLWFGGHRIGEGKLEVGSMMAYLTYLVQILMSVMMASFMLVLLPRASVCADRIGEVLHTDSSVVLPTAGVTEVDPVPSVVFDHVEFSYPGADAPVLSDVSFTAAAGQTTAIIGSTGAGKTTLLGLIPRLFDATLGSVEVNGVDVRDLDADTLWDQLGLVPQKAYLFSGTIASNLRYGNPQATDEELWEALEVAQAADFVRDMPDGLEASIAQGGTNVSGGQRQRLAIARALVARPGIYLFDDSFSALDVGTDARLRAALVDRTRDACVIIVAQRVSTIRNADQIIVLEDGEIVGLGTHDTLLDTNATYRGIVESQLEAGAQR